MATHSSIKWRQLGQCEYKYCGKGGKEKVCGEPAVYKLWWIGEKVDSMLACKGHLDFLYFYGGSHPLVDWEKGRLKRAQERGEDLVEAQ